MNREEKIKQLKEKHKIKCIYVCFDGVGHYCKLGRDTSGFHKYKRVFCFGRKNCFCKFPKLYKEKESIECSECKGWGYKNIRIEDGKNVYEDCTKCKKTGRIEKEK